MLATLDLTNCSIQTKRTLLTSTKKDTFSITLKDTNNLIGFIKLNKLPPIKQLNDTELQGINVNYNVNENDFDVEIIIEVIKAIISHSFFSRHLDFLTFSHLENDEISEEIITKCKFNFYTTNEVNNKSYTNYILFNYYKRNNCHCELCLTPTTCLCKLCPNHDFCLINKPVSCKFKVN